MIFTNQLLRGLAGVFAVIFLLLLLDIELKYDDVIKNSDAEAGLEIIEVTIALLLTLFSVLFCFTAYVNRDRLGLLCGYIAAYIYVAVVARETLLREPRSKFDVLPWFDALVIALSLSVLVVLLILRLISMKKKQADNAGR